MNGLFGGWFSWLGGFKTMIGIVIVMLPGYLLIPCLMPLLVKNVTGLIEAAVKQKMATQLLILKGYQQLMEVDVL